MPSLLILLATLGLAVNILFWSVPAFVAAAPFAHRAPTTRPSVPVALVGLLSAELEAVQVAGVAIEHPSTPNLGQRADQAGARVHDPVIRVVRRFEVPEPATVQREHLMGAR